MYSGKEGVEYPTGWALNPMAYQHVPSEQVDWAALAQQWIQMKETCPPAASMAITPHPPPPPPPPIISTQNDTEGGEAPMDVEGGDIDAPAPPVIAPQQWNNAIGGWDNTWNAQWGNWGWPQNSGATKTPLMPTPDAPYQGYTTGDNSAPGYTSTNNASQQQSYSGGYWSSEDSNPETKTRLPMRGSRFSPNRQGSGPRRGGPHLQRHNQLPIGQEVPDTTQTIDAAKRKQLPAWIREGLEKMEREKQKQMDREREKRDREEFLRAKKLEEEKSLQESQPDDGMPKLPAKSKFDSDSEKSDNEEKEVEREGIKIDRSVKAPSYQAAPPPLLKRSQEEIMKDLMLNVRRTLTEILLEVTDDQIHSIAKEELSRVKSHSQASRGATVASKLQGLSTIGGGLGLGIYGDSSDSESESGADSRSGTPDRRQREKSGDITDGQLQDIIRRRKAEFEKTSREIESRIAEEERVEMLRAKKETSPNPHRSSSSSPSTTPDREPRHTGSDGESTTTNNRKEQNINNHRKSSRDGATSLADTSKRHTPERVRKEDHKYSTDKNNKHQESSFRYENTHESKRSKDKSPKKSKTKSRDTSDSSSSEHSNSDSEDSFLNKKKSGSVSESSNSSDSSQKSSSKSESDTSYKHSKKKKRRTSDDSVKDKKHKSKSKKQKSKHTDKRNDRFEIDDLSSSKKKLYDREESVTRDSRISSRNSAHSPDRKSHKSKHTHRSRSRSDDRKNKKYDSTSKKYDSYKSRDGSRDRSSYSREYRSRSRDKRGRSREKRGRSREYRSRSREREWSRDRERRSRSRERRERSRDRDRRGRSREGRRDRRGDSRSYYY